MRIALLKRERESRAGVELLQLCTTITADGSISDDEISALRKWLSENERTPFPAIPFLRGLIEQIIADGKVTTEERDELYRAIERVLPTELKEAAKSQRRHRAAQEFIEKRRNAPVQFDFMVAGVGHEGRSGIVRSHARAGTRAWLKREPLNPVSSNAVRVIIPGGFCVGYVPEDFARRMAPLLDSGHKQAATLTKLVHGRSYLIPVIVATIFPPSATVNEIPIEETHFPSLQELPAPAQRSGCLGIPVFGCLILFSAAFLFVLLRC